MQPVSLRVSQYVWAHSPARHGARLVHLALADAAVCNRGHRRDADCDCADVVTLPCSIPSLCEKTQLSPAGVKAGLGFLRANDLTQRIRGGHGTEVSRYLLRLPEPPPGCPCGFCYAYRLAPSTSPLNRAGARFWPPVEKPEKRGPDIDHRGSDSDASGSDSDPYTDTDLQLKKTDETGCGYNLSQIRAIKARHYAS